MKNFSVKTADFDSLSISGEAPIVQSDLGTAPNQIPLNKDLGSLAYMNAPQIEDLNVDTLELREIDSEFQLFNEQGAAVDAIDMFVYDTRKDSDGGAWRSRTQHTSWYNEELNTATRGSRREFPAVAVIVAEADKVTIYDGDDPDLNMWMVFDRGSGTNIASNFSHIGPSNVSLSSIHAVNSQICIAGNGGSDMMLFQVKLINDHTIGWFTNFARLSSASISKRNTGTLFTHAINSVGVISTVINDVAMTVLPNAPIDTETGLPVPTIAVATDGGVSVIKDDGSVVDIVYTNQTIESLWLKQNRIWITAGNGALIVGDIPDTDKSSGTASGLSSSINGWNAFANTNETLSTLGSTDTLTLGEAFGSDQGLNLIYEKKSNPASSLVAYTTSSYNTGWMPGDIKLATLSDTKIEKVGDETPELVTNNEFATDNDWTKEAGWSIPGVTAVASSTDGNISQIVDDLTIGQTYKISIKVLTVTGGTVSYRATSTEQGGALNIYRWDSVTGIREIVFKADTTSMRIGVYGNQFSGTIDSVSLKQTGELITNGTFDNETTGWLGYNGGNIDIDSNRLSVEGSAYQEINVENGKTYLISCKVELGSTIGSRVGIEYVLGARDGVETPSNEGGEFILPFTSSITGTVYVRAFTQSNGTAYFYNISVRLAEDDRSVNDNGLQIFGEIDKTPVVPGADLVAYSGFSADNYLMQPYNSDLDFGMGDFCVMGWAKFEDSGTRLMFSLGAHDGTSWINNSQLQVIKNTSNLLQFRFNDNNFGGDSYYAQASVSLNVWNFIVGTISSEGIKLYINGILVGNNTYRPNFNNPNATLIIGRTQSGGGWSENTNLSLLRISATAPTDEQIAKIYRDEKVLFQDGAQATLYGTSDAVTALAYDDSENLLHVGTASGRSVFNGLKRVENTDVAVTTAISAKKGFVIAQ